MAITSRGYEGTIDYADWAVIASRMGGTYSVRGSDPFPLTAGAGDREVVIGAGTAAGAGILDTSDSNVSLSGASVTSGSRWDMVVLRRVWGVTNATTLALIQGGSSKVLPTRNTNPGTADDQPLYLVRFAAGQTALQEVVDLRVWRGDGGPIFANDLMVRDYMNQPGTVIRVGNGVYSRILVAGSPAWHLLADWELRGSDGVRWMVEAGTGKVYLRDDTNATGPFAILRDGTLTAGKIPWRLIVSRPDAFPPTTHTLDSHTGVLPIEKGGHGATTRSAALAALGFRYIDTGTITVLPGESVIAVDVEGSPGDWVPAGSFTNSNVTVTPYRASGKVGVTLKNDTGTARSGTCLVILMRK